MADNSNMHTVKYNINIVSYFRSDKILQNVFVVGRNRQSGFECYDIFSPTKNIYITRRAMGPVMWKHDVIYKTGST